LATRQPSCITCVGIPGVGREQEDDWGDRYAAPRQAVAGRSIRNVSSQNQRIGSSCGEAAGTLFLFICMYCYNISASLPEWRLTWSWRSFPSVDYTLEICLNMLFWIGLKESTDYSCQEYKMYQLFHRHSMQNFDAEFPYLCVYLPIALLDYQLLS